MSEKIFRIQPLWFKQSQNEYVPVDSVAYIPRSEIKRIDIPNEGSNAKIHTSEIGYPLTISKLRAMEIVEMLGSEND